jgi:ribosomal protein S27E
VDDKYWTKEYGQMKLGYKYRLDGHFLVRMWCELCNKTYDVYALSNTTIVKRCPDCEKIQVNTKVN